MKKIKLSNGATIFGYIIFSVLGYLSFNNAYLPLLIISILEIIKQIRNHNFITAYTFWQLGFSLIICLDGILQKEEIIKDTSVFIYLKTAILFYVSALLIIWYYRKLEKKNKEYYKVEISQNINIQFFLIIVFLYVFFLTTELPSFIEAIGNSRFELLKKYSDGGVNANKSIIGQIAKHFSEFCGYLLPSLIFIWNTKRYGVFSQPTDGCSRHSYRLARRCRW